MFKEHNTTESEIMDELEKSDCMEELKKCMEYGRLVEESAAIIPARLGKKNHTITIDIVNPDGAVIGDAVIEYNARNGVENIDSAVVYVNKNGCLVLECYYMESGRIVREKFEE